MKKTITFLILLLITVTVTAQKTVEASNILADIKAGKDINIKNATISGVLDFTYMEEAMKKIPQKKKKSWWNGDSNYSNEIKKLIEVAVIFEDCIFEDDVLAYIPDEDSGYTFTASFDNTTIFKNCKFTRKAMFKYSRFESETDFSSSIFDDDSTFKYAKFDDTVSFEKTKFDESATFKYAEFKRFVSFKNALFEDTATFKYTKFKNGVSFNNARFEEDLSIKYTVVTGNFDITNMKVAYEIDDKYTKINGKSFSKYIIEQK
jgi:hypothetical protein